MRSIWQAAGRGGGCSNGWRLRTGSCKLIARRRAQPSCACTRHWCDGYSKTHNSNAGAQTCCACQQPIHTATLHACNFGEQQSLTDKHHEQAGVEHRGVKALAGGDKGREGPEDKGDEQAPKYGLADPRVLQPKLLQVRQRTMAGRGWCRRPVATSCSGSSGAPAEMLQGRSGGRAGGQAGSATEACLHGRCSHSPACSAPHCTAPCLAGLNTPSHTLR